MTEVNPGVNPVTLNTLNPKNDGGESGGESVEYVEYEKTTEVNSIYLTHLPTPVSPDPLRSRGNLTLLIQSLLGGARRR